MGVGGGQTNTSCILDPDPNRQVISMQMCGNGIVEAGEECDPGLGSNSTCCDPRTCKFTTGAVCDPSGSTCCTSDCRLAPATQLCRKSRDGRCDVAEFCTGNSSTCPTDITTPNGEGRFLLQFRRFSYLSKAGLVGVEGLRVPTAFAHHWTVGFCLLQVRFDGRSPCISAMSLCGFHTRAGQDVRGEERQVLPSLMPRPQNAQPVHRATNTVSGWFTLRCAQHDLSWRVRC